MRVNGTLVDAKLCTFTLESMHFIFNKCPIYTHDGASAKFSTNSHETDYSAGNHNSNSQKLELPRWWPSTAARETWIIQGALRATPRKNTDEKENQIFLKYKEIQNGAVANSFMRKGFLMYEEMRKYLAIYEEAVSHTRLCNCSILIFLISEENLNFLFLSVNWIKRGRIV
jgi:hypothetical protein